MRSCFSSKSARGSFPDLESESSSLAGLHLCAWIDVALAAQDELGRTVSRCSKPPAKQRMLPVEDVAASPWGVARLIRAV